MIIVKLMGGLGNQMFQYANGYALSKMLNTSLFIDKSFLEEKQSNRTYTFRDYELWKFEINCKFISKRRLFILKLKSKIYKLIFDNFFLILGDKDFLELNNLKGTKNQIIYLNGYWQSETLLKPVRNELLDVFKLSSPTDDANSAYLHNIAKENSISIHVRRGDYVSNLEANQYHGVCSIEYYRTAIRLMIEEVENPSFYFFSDDMEWVKRELKIGINYKSTYIENSSNHFDLLLMSKCKHNIIANSSFSWWGAWLNQNNYKIVVAPRNWFAKDYDESYKILPDNWIKID